MLDGASCPLDAQADADARCSESFEMLEPGSRVYRGGWDNGKGVHLCDYVPYSVHMVLVPNKVFRNLGVFSMLELAVCRA